MSDGTDFRRTVLAGRCGTVVGAARLLEAMLPRCAARPTRRAKPAAPRRMAFIYVPNGATWKTGRRRRKGPTTSLPPILQPLAPRARTT